MAQAPAQILVVDDEEEVRALLRKCLEREGYLVRVAKDGDGLRAALSSQRPDLITLDLTLGGEDGLELARQIRGVCNVPIIMISGKGDTIDRVVGLEVGADDYIAKPFQLREVVARVRAVLRRNGRLSDREGAGAERHERFGFGDLTIDVTSRELSRAGVPLEITTAEFNLLALFMKRPQRVLSRDEIMDALKGHDWSPLDRSIDALVGRLRRKVEGGAGEPRLIKTVRGVGYLFAGDAKRL